MIYKILFLLFLVQALLAQDAGKTGLSFLKISTSARNAALADMGSALSKDLSAVFYNPSLITSLESAAVGVTYNKWFEDANYSVFTMNADLAGIPFAVSINSFSVPGIEIREKPGDPLGTFKAQYFSGSFVTGYKVYKELSIGVGGKYIYEGLFSEEGTGYAFDFGVSHSGIMEGLSLGFSVRNIGSMKELKNASTELPSELRGGGTYKMTLPEYKVAFVTGADMIKYMNYSDLKFSVGGEATYDRLLSIRAGYRTGVEAVGFSFGFGINWNSIQFDYAFLPFSDGLGNGNIIGLIYNF
ncbi:MAG: PorV/PorQ family protein [Ignavibacteriaceae bacterium]|nr:PorV/PorQ family protein [Ignavibacteriaceae bacterium]